MLAAAQQAHAIRLQQMWADYFGRMTAAIGLGCEFPRSARLSTPSSIALCIASRGAMSLAATTRPHRLFAPVLSATGEGDADKARHASLLAREKSRRLSLTCMSAVSPSLCCPHECCAAMVCIWKVCDLARVAGSRPWNAQEEALEIEEAASKAGQFVLLSYL